MEWKKTLAFSYGDRTTTFRWRSDGVCFFLNTKHYPDPDRNRYQEELDAERWERFLAEVTSIKPASEEAFDASFLWSMVSEGGTALDTGYQVDPLVLVQVLNHPLVKQLKELEGPDARPVSG
jgi:hypothetical protein